MHGPTHGYAVEIAKVDVRRLSPAILSAFDLRWPAKRRFPYLGGMTFWPAIVAIVVFTAVSFFFALAETAFFTLSKWQLRQLNERSPVEGELVGRMLGKPDDLLATIVLGNTLSNAALVATLFWVVLGGGWSFWALTPLVLILTLVVCEVAPKTLAVRAPERWAVGLARPLLLVHRATEPLRRVAQLMNEGIVRLLTSRRKNLLAPAVTEEEYHELIELAFQQGTLAAAERDIILQIIQLDQKTAMDVMRPRSQVSFITDEATVPEMIAEARRLRREFIPLINRESDTIVGFLNGYRLLLDPEIDLTEVIEIPASVPETMNLLQLLQSLQRQHRGIAVVLDEYGGTSGIVTMEEILGEVVGRLRRDGSADGFVMERQGKGRWRVNGAMRIEDFRREYPALADDPDVGTMGGLLVKLLEAVPAPGDHATLGGLKLTARITDARRVRELMVEQMGRHS
jgi:putative hemolysin